MAADFIKFVEYLLPGFLASWVFYGFTAFVRPNQFERVIQALIFTIVVESILIALRQIFDLNFMNAEHNLLIAVPVAFLVGIVFAAFANHSLLHRLAIWLNLTSETSYPSEWYGVFSKKITYVVLHLKDERRIYGWPLEWPSQSDSGHFLLTDAVWLVADESGEQVVQEMTGVDSILLAAVDVQFVEFMNMDNN